MEAPGGFLYGVTSTGGASKGGTIYRLAPGGVFELVRQFRSPGKYQPQPNVGGVFPSGDLVPSGDGGFYGVTSNGGTHGYGTLYYYHPVGIFTILHDFNYNAGFDPHGLIRTASGDLYGLMGYGGSREGGTIFRYRPDGTFSIVHSFLRFDRNPNYQNSSYLEPESPMVLMQTGNGEILGTTARGGPVHQVDGFRLTYGTIFRLKTNGDIEVLHECDQQGARPNSLIEAPGGLLYGTASGGTAAGHGGAIFRMSGGVVTILHEFTEPSYGVWPQSLLLGSDGAFYGNTIYGGSFGNGQVYKITPAEQFELLYEFPDANGLPYRGLTEGSDGFLCGVASQNKHTAFRLQLGNSQPNGNTAPVARVDSTAITKPGVLRVNVLRNDFDADHHLLGIEAVEAPADVQVTFLPKTTTLICETTAPLSGTRQVRYTVGDGHGGTAEGTLLVRPRLAGSYRGTRSDGQTSSPFSLSVSRLGDLTGSVRLGSGAFALRGTLNLDNTFTGTLGAAGNERLTARLQVTLGSPRRITGTISTITGTWQIDLVSP